MDLTGLLYIAVELDDDSSKKLKDLVKQLNVDQSDLKLFCHHMTVAFHTQLTDDLLNYCNDHKGDEFTLFATKIGISDKAIAVKVETNAPSANKNKHITLATFVSTNGKPVDSNYISKFIPFNFYGFEPIELKGVLKFYYRK